MGRMNKKAKKAPFQLFNVTYADGSITSNRRVPTDQLDQSFGDDLLDLAKTAITDQDLEISRQSKQPRPQIKQIVRA